MKFIKNLFSAVVAIVKMVASRAVVLAVGPFVILATKKSNRQSFTFLHSVIGAAMRLVLVAALFVVMPNFLVSVATTWLTYALAITVVFGIVELCAIANLFVFRMRYSRAA